MEAGEKLSLDSTGHHIQCISCGFRPDYRSKYLRSHRLRIQKHEPSKLDINELPHHKYCLPAAIRVLPPFVRVLTRETDK